MPVCTLTADILVRKELCIVSCVSLFVSTSSLRFTPTLIYSAPDLLLFCHPDMFNKYCLVGAGYIMVLQRCCCLCARKVMDDMRIGAVLSVSSNARPCTVLPTTLLKKKVDWILLNALILFPSYTLGISSVKVHPEPRIDCLISRGETASEVSSFNHSAQKQQNTPL